MPLLGTVNSTCKNAGFKSTPFISANMPATAWGWLKLLAGNSAGKALPSRKAPFCQKNPLLFMHVSLCRCAYFVGLDEVRHKIGASGAVGLGKDISIDRTASIGPGERKIS